MPIEVALNTPLADALHASIQPKLVEVGWGSGDPSDTALSEYIILMLVNGKKQEDIAAELSGDLLNLGPNDPGVGEFSRWLFEQIEVQNARVNFAEHSNIAVSQDDSTTMGDDEDMEITPANEGIGDIHAYVPRYKKFWRGRRLTSSRPTGPKAMRAGGILRGNREK